MISQLTFSTSTLHTYPNLPKMTVRKIAGFLQDDEIGLLARVCRSFTIALVYSKELLCDLAEHDWSILHMDAQLVHSLLRKGRFVRKLDCSHLKNRMCDEAFHAIAQFFPSLESLKVESDDTTTFSNSACISLRDLPLRNLEFINTKLTEDCLEHFERCPLTSLNIYGIEFRKDEYKLFKKKEIEELRLPECTISRYVLERLDRFSLHTLNLMYVNTRESIPYYLQHMTSLRKLFLTDVTDDDMVYLKDLPLQTLYACDSPDLYDTGLFFLSVSITELSFAGCSSITSEGIQELQKLPLQILDIEDACSGWQEQESTFDVGDRKFQKDVQVALHGKLKLSLEKMNIAKIFLTGGKETSSASLRYGAQTDLFIRKYVQQYLGTQREKMGPRLIDELFQRFKREFPGANLSRNEVEQKAMKEQLDESTISAVHFIDTFVQNHLTPYLNGTITKENEDRTRQPLTIRLFRECKKKFPKRKLLKPIIEEQALKAYFRIAARAFLLYTHEHALNDSEETETLFLDVLVHAVKIDFKNMKLKTNDIRDRGRKILSELVAQWVSKKMRKHDI